MRPRRPITRRHALCLVPAAALPLASQESPRQLDTFALRDPDGKPHSFTATGKVTVIVFYSTVCPISNDYNERLTALHARWQPQGVQFLVVNANSNETAADVAQHRREAAFPFPVYLDRHNALADRLGATVTPETFVLDRQGTVRYQGHIDDSRNPARARVHGLRNAIETVVAGGAPQPARTKAFGCTIKRERKDS